MDGKAARLFIKGIIFYYSLNIQKGENFDRK